MDYVQQTWTTNMGQYAYLLWALASEILVEFTIYGKNIITLLGNFGCDYDRLLKLKVIMFLPYIVSVNKQ